MSEHRSLSPATSVFADPREALGWLMNRWTGCLIATQVMAQILRDRLVDTELSSWTQLALGVFVLLGLAGVNIWGHWVSSSARPRLREAMRQRQLPWWGRDRFASEHAARRLGWPPRTVVWTGRALQVVAVTVTTIAAVVLVVT
jgi:hypothetical protein